MKNIIRKIAAVGASVAMLGMTVGGAVALDLGDLPEPFVVSDEYVSTAMVIGSTLDASARTTLKTYFDGFVDESVGDVTSVSDTEKIYMGEGLTYEFAAALDDGDIDELWDDGITFEGESYETHESVHVTGNVIFTSSGLENDEDLSDDPVVYTNATKSWGYRYIFDEDFSEAISSTDELSITFLGKDVKISSISSDNAVTLKTGVDVSLGQDSEVAVDGHVLHVGTIFETSVEVWVDNEDHTFLDEDESETFNIGTDQVEVTVENIGYTDDVDSRTVLLTYGEDITKTVSDGDAVQVELDEPDVDDDASDAVWNWDISIAAANITADDYIGIVYYQKVNKADDDPLPLQDGDYFVTPYDYLTLNYDLVEQTYNEYTVEFEKDYDVTSTIEIDVIVFSASDGAAGNDGFVYNGEDTNRVACAANATCWYEDSDGDFIIQNGTLADDNTTFYIESGTGTTKGIVFFDANDDATVVNGTASTVIKEIVIQDVETTDDGPTSGSLSFNVTIADQTLGTTIGDADAGDLMYDDGRVQVNIGTWDDGDLLTAYGIKVTDIESNVDSDELTILVPEKEIYADFSFSLRGTGSTSEVDLVTASESVSGYDNLILVGGPAVNSVTADFMGLTFPAYAEASTIAADSAIIQLVEKDTQTALIVAGWETADTQRAATNVAAGDLTGDSLVV